MLFYSAFGLEIASDIRLDGLTPGNGRADVHVRWGDLSSMVERVRDSGSGHFSSPDKTFFFWKDVGAFQVSGGREILVDPEPSADPGEIQIGLLGPSMAALLAQRGLLLLHGSAVAIDGAGVVFMGASGWGKSTLAASLRARGHPLVVDDLSAIRFQESGALLHRGFPHQKLWPDSASALGEDLESLPRIGIDYVKRRLSTQADFYGEDVLPLRRVYVLAGGEAPEIEVLSSTDAFLQLTLHSYGIRWFLRAVNASQFQERARLAREVGVRRLKRPADLGVLGELAELVERDVRSPS